MQTQASLRYEGGVTQRPSAAREHYLTHLYWLIQNAETVHCSQLAEAVEVSVQAATRMMHTLVADGLIEHAPYEGVSLTADGQTAALLALRRYLLCETFLHEVMNVAWWELHTQADCMRAGVNRVIEARMDTLLNYPTRSPLGEPIPNADSSLPVQVDIPLETLQAGKAASITWVNTRNDDELAYFYRAGIRPGKCITVTERLPFDGPYLLEVAGREIPLQLGLAQRLFVETGAPDK